MKIAKIENKQTRNNNTNSNTRDKNKRKLQKHKKQLKTTNTPKHLISMTNSKQLTIDKNENNKTS